MISTTDVKLETVTDGPVSETITFSGHDLKAISTYDLTRVQSWPPARVPVSNARKWLHLFIQRVNILIWAIPLAGLVVAIRYGNLTINKGKPLTSIDYTIAAPVVTIASFIMGIVLNNVIADYKESEKIPAELLAYFHGILMFARTHAMVVGYDPKPIMREVEAMLLCMMSHFDHKGKTDFVEAVASFNNAFLEYSRIAAHEHEKKGGEADLENPQHMACELIKKWGRVNDISRTSIILSAYTLLDVLTAIMIATLVSVQYKTQLESVSGAIDFEYAPVSGYWVTGIFSTVVIYIGILARSLDDPFDCSPGFHFETYVNGGPVLPPILGEFMCVNSIDFEPLFADFGSELRELLYKPHSAVSARIYDKHE